MALLPFLFSSAPKNPDSGKGFYDIQFRDIYGETHTMKEFAGKKILIVNVASYCGFTPQYKSLAELQNTYKDKLVILGFPCNQFLFQEPGGNSSIASFCSKNYNVNFLMGEKIKVEGLKQHPLYHWLSHASANGWNNKKPSWNFFKYLVDENGKLLKWFPSDTEPLSTEITSLL